MLGMREDPPNALLERHARGRTIAAASDALADRHAGLQEQDRRLCQRTGELVHRSRVQRRPWVVAVVAAVPGPEQR